MQNARDILLATSRRLNDGIRALEATVESGGPATAEINAIRREAGESLGRLRSVQGASGVVGDTIPKVIQHLDLFMEIASSAGSAPALSRKLLRHLLDEQLELTALAERDGVAATGIPAVEGRRERPARGIDAEGSSQDLITAESAPGSREGEGRHKGVASDTGEAFSGAGVAAAVGGGSDPRAVPATSSPRAVAELPGGRRSLTVGSLIGR